MPPILQRSGRSASLLNASDPQAVLPDVIVLDEATSSRDVETDAAEMAALSGMRTLMLTAHRLTNLNGTDVVHALDEARPIASGPPDIVLPTTTVEPIPSIVGLR